MSLVRHRVARPLAWAVALLALATVVAALHTGGSHAAIVSAPAAPAAAVTAHASVGDAAVSGAGVAVREAGSAEHAPWQVATGCSHCAQEPESGAVAMVCLTLLLLVLVAGVVLVPPLSRRRSPWARAVVASPRRPVGTVGPRLHALCVCRT